jgi:hypothetical protein
VYDPGAFERTRTPSTALRIFSASPASVQRGQTVTVTVLGRNIAAGAAVTFGTGITAGPPTVAPGEVSVPLQISATAAFGKRTITVTNPAGTSAALSGALVVAPPPLTVALLVPTQDRVGRGNQTTPSGVPDVRLRLTGLAAAPRAIRVVSDAGGIWHRPYNSTNWIIDYLDLGGGAAEIFLEPFGTPSAYTVTVTYPDGSTASGTSARR